MKIITREKTQAIPNLRAAVGEFMKLVAGREEPFVLLAEFAIRLLGEIATAIYWLRENNSPNAALTLLPYITSALMRRVESEKHDEN